MCSRDLARGVGGRPGGDPVIDYDDRPSREWEGLPVASVPLGPPLQLGSFTLLHSRELLWGHTRQPNGLGVENPHAVLTDGTHPQFRLERHPQLSDNDDVKWRI